MKGMIKIQKHHFKLFLIAFLFLFLSACNGGTPALPVINSFTASPSTIDAGDSAVLNWSVTNATSIIIVPGNMTFTSSSGSVAVFPAVTTNYTLTATNAEGSVSSSVALSVTPTEPVEQTLTIQPGPEGKDSYVSSNNPGATYWTSPYISIGRIPKYSIGVNRANYMYMYDYFDAYLQFNLGSLPAGAVVVNAVLKLYQTASLDTSGLMIGVHQVTQEWEESTITWDNKPDCLTSPESTVTVPTLVTGWLSWNISSLVQGWANGSIVNNGIALQDDSMAMEYIYINCCSSDYTDNPALCPKLEIIYYVP